MNIKLGWKQRAILKTLRQHGDYYKGCGWVWSGHLTTVRLLDSLVRRGLVETYTKTIDPLIHPSYETTTYRLTDDGLIEAGGTPS